MPKFFQSEIAAYNGTKTKFTNVKFKKGDFENSDSAVAGTLLEVIPVHIKNPPLIQFIAYIDQLSDSFSPEYTSEQPFGRTDPYYIWKGSKLTHGNKENATGCTRVSFDFRVMLEKDYLSGVESFKSSRDTNKKFVLGQYYRDPWENN